jgi:hypothetical protein
MFYYRKVGKGPEYVKDEWALSRLGSCLEADNREGGFTYLVMACKDEPRLTRDNTTDKWKKPAKPRYRTAPTQPSVNMYVSDYGGHWQKQITSLHSVPAMKQSTAIVVDPTTSETRSNTFKIRDVACANLLGTAAH